MINIKTEEVHCSIIMSDAPFELVGNESILGTPTDAHMG